LAFHKMQLLRMSGPVRSLKPSLKRAYVGTGRLRLSTSNFALF
jgi:hypothetical protein